MSQGTRRQRTKEERKGLGRILMSTFSRLHYLGPQLAGTFLTPEEFDAVRDVDRDYRYELIDGRLIVTPIPLEAERGPNEELGHLLLCYRDYHPQGASLDGTLHEHTLVTPQSRRRADRVIWAGLGRRPAPRVDVPQIVAEWVSESRRDWQRDYIEKREEYRETGVSENWIFDRFRRTMTVYRFDQETTKEIVIRENEIYQTPLLPGFELPLARLFAVADQWR
jgi:Uma2 family endonuclease